MYIIMKNLFPICTLLILFTTSCYEELGPDIACDVRNPTENLSWLADKIRDIEAGNPSLLQFYFISQARYRSQTVFFIENCCPNCLFLAPAVYNCGGVEIGTLSAEDIKLDKLKNISVIWTPEDFSCNVNY